MNSIIIYNQYENELYKALKFNLKQFAYDNYNGLLREISRARYKYKHPESKIECELSYDDAFAIDNSLMNNPEYKIAKSVRNSLKAKKHRFNHSIKNIIYFCYTSKYLTGEEYFPFFISITFKPSIMDNTTPKTRKTYIARLLKQYSFHYVANIDSGSKTHREHYHGVVAMSKTMIDKYMKKAKKNIKGRPTFNHIPIQEKLGWNTFQYIVIPELMFNDNIEQFEDIIFHQDFTGVKIANYMEKLTNHSFKIGTSESVIYGRNKKEMMLINQKLKRTQRTIKLAKELFGDDFIEINE